MAIPETPGERMRARMKELGIGNQQVADAAGVHVKTVSQWLNDRFPGGPADENLKPVADLLGVTIPWIRYGTDAPGRVSEGNGASYSRSTAVAAGEAVTAPNILQSQRVRVWLSEFRAKLTRADVPDDQIEAAIALMKSPQALTYYKGGRTHDFTEDEAILELEGLAQVVIDKQKSLGRKFKS